MKNIGVLGGAFNPLHEGHLQLAEFSTQYFDEVWLMPAYSHTHGKQMLGAQHRFIMCNLALRKRRSYLDHKIIVSDFELKNKVTDGTFQSMWELITQYSNWKFSFIIGQDNADTLDTWIQAEQLKMLVPFLVIPRQGYARNHDPDVWYSNGHHRYISQIAERDAIMQISSTEIREQLKQGKKPDAISDQVFNYIRKHRLYGYVDAAEQPNSTEDQVHTQ